MMKDECGLGPARICLDVWRALAGVCLAHCFLGGLEGVFVFSNDRPLSFVRNVSLVRFRDGSASG